MADRPKTNVKPTNEREGGKRYIKTTESDPATSFETLATVLSWVFVIILFPVSIFCCLVRVNEFNRALIFRLGRVRPRARGPGLIWILPCIDDLIFVDLRTRVEVIPQQDVITKDSVTITVDGVLFYYIEHAMHATIQIANVHESTIFIAQTTLRNIMGSMTLHDLLVSRTTLSAKIKVAVDHLTTKWGVRVERVEIKDISLPESLERSLASEAEALREARAKIISAEGELKASKALKEASDTMAKNKITLQLRHLQILTSIAQDRNVKIIYPFPLEMLKAFEGGRQKGGNTADSGNEALFPLYKRIPKELKCDKSCITEEEESDASIYQIHSDTSLCEFPGTSARGNQSMK